MPLHTLNATPNQNAFAQCLRMLGPQDALLLLGDGVYGAIKDTEAAKALQNSGAELYILEPDARASGLEKRLAECFKPLDYDGFVELSERFPSQQAWY